MSRLSARIGGFLHANRKAHPFGQAPRFIAYIVSGYSFTQSLRHPLSAGGVHRIWDTLSY